MISLFASTIYFHLPVMLVIVSIVYSATRHDDWGMIFREAFRWGLRMTLFLAAIGLVLFGLTSLI